MLARSSGEAIPLRSGLDLFPAAVGGWRGQEATTFDAETLSVLKVTDYLMRRYVDGAGRSVWLYVAYWDTQRRGAQIHSPKNCLPGSGWEPLEASVLDIPLASGTPLAVNRYLVQKDRDVMLVVYWYQSQGRAIASEVDARMQMTKNAILRNRTDGALVRVTSPVYGSVADTEALVVTYVQNVYPRLAAYLPDSSSPLSTSTPGPPAGTRSAR
jgi:EpsI family protein